MPRLFSALEITDNVASQLELMRGGIPGARWIERDAYHVTLRFYGDMDDRTANDLAEELARIECGPFEISLKELGYFGGAKPHSLHVKVTENEALSRLQSATERAARGLNVKLDRRKFMPHVTIARLKDAQSGDVEAFINQHNLYRSEEIEVERFVLMSARSSRGGGPYVVEEAYDLWPVRTN